MSPFMYVLVYLPALAFAGGAGFFLAMMLVYRQRIRALKVLKRPEFWDRGHEFREGALKMIEWTS